MQLAGDLLQCGVFHVVLRNVELCLPHQILVALFHAQAQLLQVVHKGFDQPVAQLTERRQIFDAADSVKMCQLVFGDDVDHGRYAFHQQVNTADQRVFGGGFVKYASVVAFEKGFQRGGDELRREGVRVDSLAIVESMSSDGTIEFRK